MEKGPVELSTVVQTELLVKYTSTREGYKQFRDMLDTLLEEYNFKKVHKVMEYLGWTWANLPSNDPELEDFGEEYRVPTEEDMKSVIRREAIRCIEEGRLMYYSGGFHLRFHVDDGWQPNGTYSREVFEDRVTIALTFELEEWSVYNNRY